MQSTSNPQKRIVPELNQALQELKLNNVPSTKNILESCPRFETMSDQELAKYCHQQMSEWLKNAVQLKKMVEQEQLSSKAASRDHKDETANNNSLNFAQKQQPSPFGGTPSGWFIPNNQSNLKVQPNPHLDTKGMNNSTFANFQNLNMENDLQKLFYLQNLQNLDRLRSGGSNTPNINSIPDQTQKQNFTDKSGRPEQRK